MRKIQKAFSAKLKSYFLRNQFAVRYGWIAVRMLWSLVRVTLVFKVFSKHSDEAFLNALMIDMGTSYVEAWATGRAVLAYVTNHKKKARPYVALAAFMFVAPELFLILFWNGLPEKLVVGIGIFIVCSLFVFLNSLFKKVRELE